MLIGILLLLVSQVASFLYPHTLLNTDVPCSTMKDCEVHYNHSWCTAAGVMCIHRYCKLIPEYPCRATQDCIEETRLCVDKVCKKNSDCNNHIYCDGEEICSKQGYCVIDPDRPSCHYTGGKCDEHLQKCYQPKVRLSWRTQQTNGTGVPTPTATPGNEDVSQDTAGVTSLVIIGFFTGLLFLVGMIAWISKSVKGYITRRL